MYANVYTDSRAKTLKRQQNHVIEKCEARACERQSWRDSAKFLAYTWIRWGGSCLWFDRVLLPHPISGLGISAPVS